MAFEPKPSLFSTLGTVIWGDFGTLTMYRSKRKKLVIFKKTWPDKPPSDRQLAWRATWSAAAAAWRALTHGQRTQWSLAARRASLCATGYNLWLHWKLTADDAAIRTLQNQTKTQLLPA